MIATPRILPAGLHYGVPAAVYHADPCVVPSLSSSICRVLVDQTPAHAYHAHIRMGGHPIEPTPDMIFGAYAHAIMAGDTTDFEVEDFDNYQSKVAREWRDQVISTGRTPILKHTAERAGRAAMALMNKAASGITATPFGTNAQAEVTAIWQEKDIWLRARFDRLVIYEGAYADVWDWKFTNAGVDEAALIRQIIDQGYHVQAAFYLRGLLAVRPDLAGRATFTLAFVEVDEPHAVRRVPICEGFLTLGNQIVERGVRLWRECMASNQWPDYHEHSLFLTPPTWYAQRVEERGAA